MLKIEAETTHDLIHLFWKGLCSGDTDVMIQILELIEDRNFGQPNKYEAMKKKIPNKKLLGGEFKSLDQQGTQPVIPAGTVITGIISGARTSVVKQEQEKETTMRTEAQEAKDYLIRSLDQEMWTKKNFKGLAEAFGMDIKYPKNGKELKEWFAAGRLILTDSIKDDEDFEWRSPYEFIKFRGEKERDEEGYNAALKQIDKNASDVKDTIIVFGAEEGLKALNKFKATDYSK